MSTKARVRPLREEIASAVIQGGAAAASAVGLAYLVTQAWPQQNALKLAAVVIYGASMFIAFLASAIYHGVQYEHIKAVFRKIDHCAIFLFVAGTYTPVALLPLLHHAGVMLLVLIWTLAVAGIAFRLTNEPVFHRVAVPLYLAMGWLEHRVQIAEGKRAVSWRIHTKRMADIISAAGDNYLDRSEIGDGYGGKSRRVGAGQQAEGMSRDSMRVDGGLTSDKLKAASQLQFMETIDAMHRPPRSAEGRRPRGG